MTCLALVLAALGGVAMRQAYRQGVGGRGGPHTPELGVAALWTHPHAVGSRSSKSKIG